MPTKKVLFSTSTPTAALTAAEGEKKETALGNIFIFYKST
jgi:hypothetical protein